MIPKFRAWDRLRKEMNYKVMVGNCDTDDENWTCPIIWIEEKKDWLHFDDYECIMQSTGLKDKNGVEIFEEDVVSRNSGMPSVVKFGKWIYEEDFGYKIKNIGFHLNSSYDDDEWFQAMDYEDIRKNYEVIGNIYENPELLEDKE
ncbi:YopX family protein [Streptococcus pseudopneumoniae]|uniref:YopX family protein n=1 Tax=Streptococcus pseudopneumoniae TaxID=257758 RepID=UPI001419C72F|nr:YopX family protein [Streptococcus pseudopneumoniae]NIB77043.1 hypothetical protein [Streptococcus pseudopneumoniae]